MRKKDSSLKRSLLGLAVVLAISVLSAGPAYSVSCSSANAAVELLELDASESPIGHQSASDHCFSGTLRGPLKGNFTLCVAEEDTVMDLNVCTCDSAEPLWSPEGEGRALVYRSKVWISTRSGGFEAIERGTQVENTGYPLLPYPDNRHYWAGVMQVLPDSGTGDYEGMIYGTILMHNQWNNPNKAKLMGEVCVP